MILGQTLSLEAKHYHDNVNTYLSAFICTYKRI